METTAESPCPPADALERLARLQALTAALSEAVTTEQVGAAMLSHVAAAMGADAGAVYQLSEDGAGFDCFRTIGYPEAAMAVLQQAAADPRTPLTDATANRRPVLLDSLAERVAKYPDVYEKLARVPGAVSGGAAAVLPLLVRGQAIGALALRFPSTRTFSPEDRAMLLTVAVLCAQALDRARLHDVVSRERELLRAADRRKHEFLATLAHDLRNPLAPLLNGLELMRLNRDNPATVESIRTMMERQLGQMVRLIDDLLDEFIVRLPVAPDHADTPPAGATAANAAAANAAAAETPGILPHHILVADDNQDAADSLAMVLRLQGYDVTVVHDGQEALDLAARVQPDAAFLDIGMPRMNGYDCCRQIRREPWGLRVLLVAVTGWGQEEDKRRAKEAGFDHHLTKPVAPADLERVLAQVRTGK